MHRRPWLVIGTAAASIGALVAFAAGGGAATRAAPTSADPPTLAGTPKEGETLTGQRGSWTGTITDYDDQWLRCDKTGGSCAAIGGATSRFGYKLTSADVGNTIRFSVVAKNVDGRTTAQSVPTAVVAAGTPATPKPTTPASGCAKPNAPNDVSAISSPARLTIDQTQVDPSTITFGTRTITARFHVSACGGPAAGALVYATPVPYGMFSIPNEQPTGADGWATLTFTAQAGWPATQSQQLIVMFVRARKNGESLLGGISSRRLVSFRVAR